jgi:hypothetical protein
MSAYKALASMPTIVGMEYLMMRLNVLPVANSSDLSFGRGDSINLSIRFTFDSEQ